jgi:hypothetical protein
MGNDGKAHLTGNKKWTVIDRIENSKRDTIRKNSWSFETIPSSQNHSVRAVGRDITDGRTDRQTENRCSAHAMAKNFFLLKITYNHLLRVKTCFLVFALLSVVRCSATKQKEICCAINTTIFQFLIYWKRNAQQWIIYFSVFESFFLFFTILLLR